MFTFSGLDFKILFGIYLMTEQKTQHGWLGHTITCSNMWCLRGVNCLSWVVLLIFVFFFSRNYFSRISVAVMLCCSNNLIWIVDFFLHIVEGSQFQIFIQLHTTIVAWSWVKIWNWLPSTMWKIKKNLQFISNYSNLTQSCLSKLLVWQPSHTAPQRCQPDWLVTPDFLLDSSYCDQDMTISVAR